MGGQRSRPAVVHTQQRVGRESRRESHAEPTRPSTAAERASGDRPREVTGSRHQTVTRERREQKDSLTRVHWGSTTPRMSSGSCEYLEDLLSIY